MDSKNIPAASTITNYYKMEKFIFHSTRVIIQIEAYSFRQAMNTLIEITEHPEDFKLI